MNRARLTRLWEARQQPAQPAQPVAIQLPLPTIKRVWLYYKDSGRIITSYYGDIGELRAAVRRRVVVIFRDDDEEDWQLW